MMMLPYTQEAVAVAVKGLAAALDAYPLASDLAARDLLEASTAILFRDVVKKTGVIEQGELAERSLIATIDSLAEKAKREHVS